MIGGLCLFLFGMNLLGQALERRTGGQLRSLLGRLTANRAAGFFTGLGVTAVIQSSSATSVMVVGFVNSGLMTLKQAIHVIMGANVGTTVTAFVLSLAGIDSQNLFIQLLKPASFTPILALIGIILYMFCKSGRKKDTGMILLGFATLMFGLETMTEAVAGLGEIPAFQELLLLFKNPLLGVLAGMIVTAVIQSSSASVGILQALAATGRVTYGAAIPIIMGQNIGTCVTAILSAIGASRNAKRAAMVLLLFNFLGTTVWLAVFWVVEAVFSPMLLAQPASLFGVALVHAVFNVLCTLVLLPLTGVLERIVMRLVREPEKRELSIELDERLFTAPAAALERGREAALDMAVSAVEALRDGLQILREYTPALADSIRIKEEKTDEYEDKLSTFLVHLSAKHIREKDIDEAATLLKSVGDFERIADHAMSLSKSAEEWRTKEWKLMPAAKEELAVMSAAVEEILALTLTAFADNDQRAASQVEPLEQVIDQLREQMRSRHILRLQREECAMESGFVWSDLLTDLGRTAAHCSNIAGNLMDAAQHHMNRHETLRAFRQDSEEYRRAYEAFCPRFSLPALEE